MLTQLPVTFTSCFYFLAVFMRSPSSTHPLSPAAAPPTAATRPGSPLARATVIAIGLYLLWFLGYEHYLAPAGRLDAALTQNLAQVSAAVLRLLGFTVTVTGQDPPLIHLAQHPVLFIGNACNGLVLYALFSGFIVAFPGPVRRKLWFIPAGLVLLYSLNVLRIVGLCLNVQYFPSTVDFNHHYTFALVVYAAIFGLWMWWATRGARPASPYATA